MKSDSSTTTMKGFTLIEILIVIAIIGILATIVMRSMNMVRVKAADISTKATLSNMRSQAAIYYDTNLAFSTSTMPSYPIIGCASLNSLFLQPIILMAIDSVTRSSGAAPICALSGVNGEIANSWAISAVTNAGTSSTWCIDSTGKAVAGKVANTGVCL